MATAIDRSYTHRVTVEGRGEFPWDMLRKDRCYPRTEADSHAMATNTNTTRRVTLVHTGGRWWMPVFLRWASFGWHVVEWHYEDPHGRERRVEVAAMAHGGRAA